jgi:hypothetical protein
MASHFFVQDPQFLAQVGTGGDHYMNALLLVARNISISTSESKAPCVQPVLVRIECAISARSFLAAFSVARGWWLLEGRSVLGTVLALGNDAIR